MRLDSRVKFIGRDPHRMREPLTGSFGVVRAIVPNALSDGRQSVLVEFDRDAPHEPYSGGWWIDRNQLQEVSP